MMEAESADLFKAWTANWDDLMDFEIVPVRSYAEAVEAIVPLL